MHGSMTCPVVATVGFEVASLHPMWLKNGAHVVTANKRALSNSLELYNSVYSAMRLHTYIHTKLKCFY